MPLHLHVQCKLGHMFHLIPMQLRVRQGCPSHSHKETPPKYPWVTVSVSFLNRVSNNKKNKNEKKIGRLISCVCVCVWMLRLAVGCVCVFKCRACILCICCFACIHTFSLSSLILPLQRPLNPIPAHVFSL